VLPQLSDPAARQAVQPHVFLLDVLITGLGGERQGWGQLACLLLAARTGSSLKPSAPTSPTWDFCAPYSVFVYVLQRKQICHLLLCLGVQPGAPHTWSHCRSPPSPF
jgi:hypothetical protein